MKVAITVPEIFSDSIYHFANVANNCQAYFNFEPIQLSESEENIFEKQDITPDKTNIVLKDLYDIKITYGYQPEDLVIVFFEKRLLDPRGREALYSAGHDIHDEDPAIALVSLDYLLPGRNIIYDPENASVIGKSIQLNILTVLTWTYTEAGCHHKTTGCILDFCSDIREINYILKSDFRFCGAEGCKSELESTDAGKAILQIVSALNNAPFRALSQMPMMPICFKTGVKSCPNSSECVPGQVFIGMPFAKDFKDIYKAGIEPALQEIGLRPWRADKQANLFDLMCKVCRGIQESQYAVIDITGQNPNVFFELGICYGLGRKTLIIQRQTVHSPADLRGMEFLVYANSDDLRKSLLERAPRVFV